MAGPRKINKGQKLAGIPADSWNAFVDTHRIVAQRRPPVNGPAQVAADDRSIVVTLRNDSGGLVPQGGVLKLGAPLVEPATRAEVVLEGIRFGGDTPDADDNEQHVGIALAPVADEQPGPFVISGDVWAQVNVSNAAHTFAKPKASIDELESDASTGFPIIWKDSGTGSKWAVVSLSKPGGGLVKVLLTASVSAASYNAGTDTLTPATFTARVWIADGANWTQSASDEKDCTNPYLTAVTVTSGSGRVAWVTTGGELVSVDCTEFVL